MSIGRFGFRPSGSVPASRISRAASSLLLGLLLCGVTLNYAVAEEPPPLLDVAQVSAGESHTCALTRDGEMKCWGYNFYGQLGDDSRTDRPTLVDVITLDSGVTASRAGDFHSCAIVGNGEVRCWGLNFNGQLGDGSTELRLTPVAVNGLGPGVRALALGEAHSCAITSAGGVKCWGANASGQLGDGSTIDRLAPVDVVGLASGFVAVAAGQRHSCAITTAGAVKCWGFNFAGQLGDGSTTDRLTPVDVLGLGAPVRAVAGGERFSCAITTSGAAKCWGANSNSQLGSGGDESNQLTGVDVQGLGSGVQALALGGDHGCALLQNGGVRCWGRNDLGQLGDDSSIRRNTPVPVIDLAEGVSAIEAGRAHSCAVLVDGGVRCWGLNFSGQLGNGETSKRFTPDSLAEGIGGDVQAVAAGEEHSCALRGGGVKCWGLNFFGQLGDGSRVQRYVAGDVSGLTGGVLAIDAGGFHNCVLRVGGGVSCWGANGFGQLGDGTGAEQTTPVGVIGLNGGVQGIAAGGVHSCAVTAIGGVKCWGHNFAGQLGDGSNERRFAPVDVSGLDSGIRSVAAGFFGHSCALTSGGGVKCWGANGSGQLGDGTTTNRSTPVDVVGLASGVVALALGGSFEGSHSCALTSNDEMKCWGANGFGQLGDNSLNNRLTPVDVIDLPAGITAIAASHSSTCALTSDGVHCWGRNDIGQVGDGSTLQRLVPEPVSDLEAGVEQINSGGEHSCAAIRALGVSCWGSNYSGQFGDGSFGGVPYPVEVVMDDGSRDVDVATASGDNASLDAAPDAAGQFVAFSSRSTNLVAGDSNASSDIFRRDGETGTTQRVSLDNVGAQIVGDSTEPAISADGRLIVFVAPDAGVAALLGESPAAKSARLKTSHYGVFLRNMVANSSQRVGTALPGGTGTRPQLAPNGNAVAFTAAPSDSAQGAVGQPNVFMVPLTRIGDAVTIGNPECVSCKRVTAMGVSTSENSDGESRDAVVSADGRFVAFATTAKNLLAASPAPCSGATSEVLLRDRLTGAAQRVSPPPGIAAVNCGVSGSTAPSIDYSGQRVAFVSDQVLSLGDVSELPDIYLFRAAEGSLVRVSETEGNDDANGGSLQPNLSGDGTAIVYVSAAINLDPDDPDNNGRVDLHVAKLDSDDTLRLADTPRGDEANGDSSRPALNFDGTALVFDSAASNLASGLRAGVSNVFERDNPVAQRPRSATWWKASESGWGLTVFDQGNVLAPTWFTYDSDGEPTWFIVGGAFPQADGSYRGDLLRLTGTRFDQISGPATTSVTPIGNVALRYNGEDTLEFDYTALGTTQTKTLDRFPFGTRGFSCTASPQASRASATNYTDLWTGDLVNAGWGLTVFHIDAGVFAIWYTYDTDGEATFFVISATRQADGSFSGEVFKQRNGTPFLQINGQRPSADADVVGNATFRFSDGDSATFTYTLGGVTQSKAIARLVVGSRPTQCTTETLTSGR